MMKTLNLYFCAESSARPIGQFIDDMWPTSRIAEESFGTYTNEHVLYSYTMISIIMIHVLKLLSGGVSF